jgi:4-amino-4-deoxy-L-arabinose transferase-like glycosyltransferase
MPRTPLLILLAVLGFIPPLFFFSVGEEGIYTISSMEMWQSRNWLIETMYGINLQRPPLMNWLVVGIANLIGWMNVLVAARLVSVLATLGMVGWLYWLCRRLFADPAFALFAALSCLTLADLSLYRGWLAYTDPLFAFFTFGAMATLWVGVAERKRTWLLASVLLVSGALLTKAFTAYVFYATVLLVLALRRESRSFLLSPASLLALSSLLVVPALWFGNTHQPGGQSQSMFNEILVKLSAEDWGSYFAHLFSFPTDTALRMSPAVLLAGYLVLRRRVRVPEAQPEVLRGALLIALLGFLPYWLAPHSSIRYLFPIYPLIALVCARLIWRAEAQELALRWFGALVALKLLFGLALFPYYQQQFRGANYVELANDLNRQIQGYPLYSRDLRSVSESIVGEMDAQRLPAPLIMAPPAEWNNGFELAMEPEAGSQVYSKLRVTNDELYLLCRGAACGAARTLPKERY